jgi:Gpi18-like mannosyltransferase
MSIVGLSFPRDLQLQQGDAVDAATIIDRGPRDQERTWFAALLIGIFALHAYPFFKYASGDLHRFVIGWYRNVADNGWAAFAEPFSNYTPTYLYLLGITSLFDGIIGDHELLKLLSIVGAIWLALASARLLHILNRPRWYALGVLLLPSIVQNTSFFGQADVFWVALCVHALSAAVERKYFWVAFWSGAAFAFKAQAVCFAPFVAYFFSRQRVTLGNWAVPLLVYVLATIPAWLAGWPLWDLLTVYLRQAQWQPDGSHFISNSASWWTIYGWLAPEYALKTFWLGFLCTAVATIAYCLFVPNLSGARLVAAAALSAGFVPFLLPGTHDRFFILADVLAFLYALARPTPKTIAAAILMQIGSALPGFVWCFELADWEIFAPPLAAAALLILMHEVGSSSQNQGRLARLNR